MKETLDSNFEQIENEDNENDSSKQRFDIIKENIEEKEKLQMVLKNLESNLEENLEEERQKQEEQNEEKDDEDEQNDKKSDILLSCLYQYQKDNKLYVWGMFLIFALALPAFVTINLIGTFQIISVMNAVSEVLSRAITCYFDLEDKEDEEYYEFTNFYSFYYKFTIDEGIEFDLIETMSFLGIILVKFYGYSISSVIFMIINVVALGLIMNFFSDYNEGFEKYSIFQIIYLIIVYILLFVGVGSSALLSQQLLIDHYERYTIFQKEVEEKRKQEKKEKMEEEAREKGINLDEKSGQLIEGEKAEEKEEIKEPYFLLICLTSVFGFLGKYLLNILISYKKNSFDEQFDFNITDTSIPNYNETLREMNIEIFNHDKFLFIFIWVIYIGSIIIFIISYKFFKNIYEGDEVEQENEENKNKGIRECNLFGYIIYIKKYDNKYLKLEENKKKDKNENKIKFINNDNINDDKNVVLVNKDNKIEINNDNEDKDKENENENLIKDEQDDPLISNKMSVTEITLGKNKPVSILYQHSDKRRKNLVQRTIDWIVNCFKSIILCLRLLSDSFISCFNEIICNFFCCGKQCCYCCCCLEGCLKNKVRKIRDEDYALQDSYFCYCYKSKRHLKWFNRFIRDDTQNKIMPLLVQYFIIQLNTVAFDKIFDENNEEGTNDFNESTNIWGFVGFFLGSTLIFFYITISFGNLYSFLSKGITVNNDEDKEQGKNKLGRSTEKLSNEILNGTYGILIFNGFFSFFLSISCLYNDINNNNYFYIPIFINKFYFFTFAHQCTIYTDNDDEINYFTVATLLSIYLQIWDLIIDQFKRIPTTGLLYMQIIISTAIIFITLYILVALLFFTKRFLFTVLYFITLPIPFFGGIWFIPVYKKYELYKKECNIFDNKECLNKMFCGEENFGKIKKRFIAG